MKTALVVVDLQNDFIPGGALAVPEGHQIIPLVDKLVKMPFDLVVATKDWHPSNHSSFASNHVGRHAGETIPIAGAEQILWPIHCVQGTPGAEFAPGWDASEVDRIFLKGIDPLVDSYSTLYDNLRQRKTGLDDYLKSQNIDTVFLVGLATDYCVKYSALDALDLGYEVYIISDACRGIDLKEGDVTRTLSDLRGRGCKVIAMDEVARKLKKVQPTV